MTKVDFYLLQSNNQYGIWLFCCRLAEKAWKLNHSVYIRTNDENETSQLDDMLWTFNAESFLPHTIQTDSNVATDSSNILLGHNIEHQTCDLLINLASSSPEPIQNYSRIAEILNEDETIKQQGRVRYAIYKQTGCDLQHHQIHQK